MERTWAPQSKVGLLHLLWSSEQWLLLTLLPREENQSRGTNTQPHLSKGNLPRHTRSARHNSAKRLEINSDRFPEASCLLDSPLKCFASGDRTTCSAHVLQAALGPLGSPRPTPQLLPYLSERLHLLCSGSDFTQRCPLQWPSVPLPRFYITHGHSLRAAPQECRCPSRAIFGCWALEPPP